MDSSWFEPVRAYCERGGGAFWAEPVNALTNAAFLLAAVAAWRAAPGDRPVRALSLLVGVVGLGSFLFHTLANTWSMFADVIPIGLFIYGYFALVMGRFYGLTPIRAAAATLAFAVFGFGLGPALDRVSVISFDRLTNGSIDYVPAILALLLIGLHLAAGRPRRPRAGRALLGLGALFVVSLALRSVDRGVCAALPLGTHFAWHLLNAAVLWGLLAVAARERRDAPGA